MFIFIEDVDKHILHFKEKYGINGVECFHSTFDELQINHLLEFCKKNHLFVSGGSDYHGVNKKNVEMAIGKGNLKIEVQNIKPWVDMMEDYFISMSKEAEKIIMKEAIKALDEYEESKEKKYKEKYISLIKDKEKVQMLDFKTIKKYV